MDQCIVYLSTARFEGEDEIRSIVQQSRLTNVALGITGILLFVRGSIIQVLEGPPSAVNQVYGRIQADARHTDITTLLNRPITQREFKEWAMGYETMTSRQLEEILAILDLDDPSGVGSTSRDSIVLRTLRTFYDSNRYN